MTGRSVEGIRERPHVEPSGADRRVRRTATNQPTPESQKLTGKTSRNPPQGRNLFRRAESVRSFRKVIPVPSEQIPVQPLNRPNRPRKERFRVLPRDRNF